MYCTEVLVTLLGLFGALTVFRGPGNCAPCPPSLRRWLLRAATRLNKPWYTTLTRGIREPWALGGSKFSIRPNFFPTSRKTNRKVLQGDDAACAICPNIGKFFLTFLILSKSSPAPCTPIALTQKLWQNTSYLQLGGLNNWFYVVVTIFAQHLNICSPKLREWRRPFPHLATRQATVTDGCLVLIVLLQLQIRRQLTLVTKRKIWHG